MTAHDERIERGGRRGTDSGRRHVSVNVHHSINLDIDLREVLTRLALADVAWGERRSFPGDTAMGPFETLTASGWLGDLRVDVHAFSADTPVPTDALNHDAEDSQ